MDGSLRSLLIAFASALVASLLLTPVARAAAHRLRIVDAPDGRRKLQKRPIALLGGVAVLMAFGLGVSGAAQFQFPGTIGQHVCIVASFCFLCAIGACDDIRSMKARWKLLSQVVAALPLAIGVAKVDGVELLGVAIPLGSFGCVFALIWLVAAINSINLIDGMDGLASTTGICAALSISVLAWHTGHIACAPISLALAGALLGFLYFNRPPASIYLGDAGSMVIGLALALLALRSATVGEGQVFAAPLLLVLGLPLVDTSLAIVRRSLSGHGISQPDRLHVHHRLLEAGLPIPQVLVLVATICLSFGLFSVASLAMQSDWFALLGLLGVMGVLLRARLIGTHEWSLIRRRLVERSLVVGPLPPDPLPAALQLFPLQEQRERSTVPTGDRKAA